MDLYVFFITGFIRLAAAMVIFFDCSSANPASIFFNPIGVPGIQTIKRLKKLKVYKRMRTQRVLILVSGIRIERVQLSGKNTTSLITESTNTTKKTII